MLPMHSELLPKIMLSEPENLAPGVKVFPFVFEKHINTPFKITFFEVLPGHQTSVDAHQVEECWLVLKGIGTLFYEEKMMTIVPYDLFYFAAFKKHQVQNVADECLVICSIYW